MDRCNSLRWTSWNNCQKTLYGNQLVFFMAYRFSKLARVAPTSNTTAAQIASIFMDHWIIPWRIPEYWITDNVAQFISKLIEWHCAFRGTQHLTKSANHPQTNRQAERLNKTIIARLKKYIAEHQWVSEIYGSHWYTPIVHKCIAWRIYCLSV